MKIFFKTVVFLLSISVLNGQNWSLLRENSDVQSYDFKPLKFKLYHIDDAYCKSILWSAPHENDVDVRNSTTVLTVPTADGMLHDFKIVEYDMMESELKAKFSEIKTFYGVSTIDGLARIRIDYGAQGFRAVINQVGKKTFIDYAGRFQSDERIVYFKHDYPNLGNWTCNVELSEEVREHNSLRIGDCQLRSYRLAQATTIEYSAYHGGTQATVMTAVTNAINRVNEVYEAELAVRLILVNNTNLLFYFTSDNYSNTGGSSDLSANQTNCTNVIGSANYDIGHVFGTGDGGIAGLGVVCSSNSKAQGYTGRPAPVGDPFVIDYVTHEMGHQFKANHTQYNSCNRNNATAMEPGSASTIMGYAGICTPNVQDNSDAYFHAKSVDEIKTFLLGNGGNCDQIVSTFNNTAPSITSQSNYSIPKSTAFALTLQATDAEDDDLYYAWDQMNAYSNPSQTMPPASTNTNGPVFRSITPTTSPTRYFPNMNTILTGSTSNTWEVVPSIGRTLNFRGVARDFTGVAGCNSEINITVTTVAAAGPFIITSQGSPVTWSAGTSQTVTWNVANTTASPISCSNVEILFSPDGGITWSSIVSSVPNNGSAVITVPNVVTSQGRIMVKAVGNVFLDVNNANITINAVLPSFTLAANPTSISDCIGTTHSSTISVVPVNGFSSNVQLTVSGLPTGASTSLSSTLMNPSQTSTLSIDFGTAAAGSYILTVTGTNGSISDDVEIPITIEPAASAPTLISPSNNATYITPIPTLSWSQPEPSLTYELEVANDNQFTDKIVTTQLTANSYTFQNALYQDNVYYWRVKATNDCGESPWSSTFNFKIEPCWLYPTENVPATPVNGIITSTLPITDRGILADLNILDVNGLQNETEGMSVNLASPTNSTLILWHNICGKEIGTGYDINFDDEAAVVSWPCPPEDGLTYRPSNALSGIEGGEVFGNWTMFVNTSEPNAQLNNWQMRVCLTNPCRLTVDHTKSNGTGSLANAIGCAVDGDTIRISSSLANDTIVFSGTPMTINKQLAIIADPGQNIYIDYIGSDQPTLWINGTVNKEVYIEGLYFLPSAHTTVSTLKNAGNLTLKDVSLLKAEGVNTVVLSNGAELDVISNVKIKD
ncbi:MAG: M12 family metallo-peptidase [Saprospiraceae bacterium]